MAAGAPWQRVLMTAPRSCPMPFDAADGARNGRSGLSLNNRPGRSSAPPALLSGDEGCIASPVGGAAQDVVPGCRHGADAGTRVRHSWSRATTTGNRGHLCRQGPARIVAIT
jgi:hypothetical protein